MTSATSPRVIWRLLDGKPGHQSQTLGLANALVRLGQARGQPVQVYDIPVQRREHGPWSWLCRRFAPGAGLPPPDWILAAGSGTHWALLCARRAYGGRAVVLMKPSLPLSWFDVVVAPEHDGVTGANVIATVGALNPMQPGEKVPGSVLVLVGGPSKHFDFDEAQVLQAVTSIMQDHPAAIVSDSRRTPPALSAQLARYGSRYTLWQACPPGWMADTLARMEQVWVTEDSVSMIYEALTAACATGLIALQPKSEGRLQAGLKNLRERGLVTAWPSAGAAQPLLAVAEADRVASGLWVPT